MTTRRVYVPDVRGDGRYLRATWHPDTASVVVSHWVGEVCVASTPIGVSEVSGLIGLLVASLHDAATAAAGPSGPPPAPGRGISGLVDRLRLRARPALAQVIALRHP